MGPKNRALGGYTIPTGTSPNKWGIPILIGSEPDVGDRKHEAIYLGGIKQTT